jgi:arylformamidase
MVTSTSAEMRIIDISVPLNERTPTYPGDPPFERASAKSRAKGDAAEVSRLSLGSHAGTHVDVPHHFVEGGADLSAVALEAFVGPCRVVEATGRRRLEAADVAAAAPAPGERILFKTDNSALWGREGFASDYAYLTGEAAEALAARGVVLVGWDYLSVEEFGAGGAPAHQALLAAGVMILEGLNLSGVRAGEYFLAALPLAVAGGDGSPVRAVLVEDWYAEETP